MFHAAVRAGEIGTETSPPASHHSPRPPMTQSPDLLPLMAAAVLRQMHPNLSDIGHPRPPLVFCLPKRQHMLQTASLLLLSLFSWLLLPLPRGPYAMFMQPPPTPAATPPPFSHSAAMMSLLHVAVATLLRLRLRRREVSVTLFFSPHTHPPARCQWEYGLLSHFALSVVPRLPTADEEGESSGAADLPPC